MANNCTINIQAVLNDLYSLNRYTAPAGAVEMAFSADNGAQVEAQMIQKNGVRSQYSITYAKGACDTPVECDDFACGGAGADGQPATNTIGGNGGAGGLGQIRGYTGAQGTGGNGGKGGDWGQNGQNGQDGTDGNEYAFGIGGIGGFGGQAGNAIVGNNLITWENTGTIYGAIS